MPVQVAVGGPRHCTDEDKNQAYEVRQLLARAGAVVIGGGIDVMAAAGVRAENGAPQRHRRGRLPRLLSGDRHQPGRKPAAPSSSGPPTP